MGRPTFNLYRRQQSLQPARRARYNTEVVQDGLEEVSNTPLFSRVDCKVAAISLMQS
jgi:hypothetical protein